MADALVKPIEARRPAVEVGQKQANPAGLVQHNIATPLNSHPYAGKPLAKPKLAVTPDIGTELNEPRLAWRTYRSIHDRDAVYIYLASVFAVVMRWQRLNCAVKKSKAALRLRRNPPQMKAEPFSIMIFCTADPETVNAKTRSKWSRVLRYAARAKPSGQRLADFIKSNGGLNECARKFALIAA